jgi:hypothetical protein
MEWKMEKREAIELAYRLKKPKGCWWPMWNDIEPPTHIFCDQPMKEGSSYCLRHFKKSITPSTERREREPT